MLAAPTMAASLQVMTWDDVRQIFEPVWSVIVEHPLLTVLVVLGILVFAALLLAFDVVVTDRGITVVFVRWPLYVIPFDTIRRVEAAPMQWSVSFGPLRWGNSPFDSSLFTRVYEFSSDPFASRVYIERTDGSVVILGPSDRDRFMTDLNARWTSRSLHDADDVILRRIAQERADAAEKNQ